MKYVVALLVSIGLYFAVTSFWSGLNGDAQAAEIPPDALFTTARGDLVVTVTETGYLKAKNSEKLKPEFKRSGTITWLIEEGAQVEAGEVLVEFEKTDVERDIEDTENGLIQYEAELEAARASLAIQERDGKASVEKWELSLEIARLNLDRYLEGEYPNELRKLRLEAEKADSALNRARESYEEVPRLAAEGFLTRIQAEEERIKLREQEILKENADRELNLFEEFTHVITRAQKEADVKDAERELENARAIATINLKEAQARVKSAERKVTAAVEKLKELEDERAKMTLRAPSPGIVHYGDPARPWYHDNVKVGNSFHRGNTIITLPDLREMQILVQVHEADIDRIEEGMDVVITIEAVKGEVFDGEITDIASVADSNWSDPTNKTFEVEVSMEQIGRELRAGITARAEIQVETLRDVTYVPIHAVFAELGEHFVFVRDGGKTARRAVEIGKNNAHYVEVLAGLEPGEPVLLFDPRTSGAAGSDPGPGDGGEQPALPVAATQGEGTI